MSQELLSIVITFILTNLMWIAISVFVYYVVVKREIFHSEYFREKQKEAALLQADMLDRFMQLTGTLSEYQEMRERLYHMTNPEESEDITLTPEQQREVDEVQKINEWLNSRGISVRPR